MTTAWPLVPLGQLLKPVSRAEPVDPSVTYRILGAHWYAKGLYVKEVKRGSDIRAAKLFRVEEGDFVYNRLFGWKGSFAIATRENHGCYVSNEFPCFSMDQDRLDPQYLWRYFSRSLVWQEALGLSTGGTPTSRNRLKEEKLLGLRIPLSPLVEQQRIVARIEELAAKIEEASNLRQQALEEAPVLDNSLLTHFIPWNAPKKTLGELIEPGSTISYGILVPGPDIEGGVPFVRVQDLDVRCPPVQPRKRVAPEVDAQYARTRLKGGEILVGVVGSIGKVGIAPPSWAGANIARAVCRIVPGPEIDRHYLAMVLQSPAPQDYFRETTRTLAQPTLNVGQLEQTPIPVPETSEQRQIVTYLENLHTRLDALKGLQAETAAELDVLLPSILDKAFKGEL